MSNSIYQKKNTAGQKRKGMCLGERAYIHALNTLIGRVCVYFYLPVSAGVSGHLTETTPTPDQRCRFWGYWGVYGLTRCFVPWLFDFLNASLSLVFVFSDLHPSVCLGLGCLREFSDLNKVLASLVPQVFRYLEYLERRSTCLGVDTWILCFYLLVFLNTNAFSRGHGVGFVLQECTWCLKCAGWFSDCVNLSSFKCCQTFFSRFTVLLSSTNSLA